MKKFNKDKGGIKKANKTRVFDIGGLGDGGRGEGDKGGEKAVRGGGAGCAQVAQRKQFYEVRERGRERDGRGAEREG